MLPLIIHDPLLYTYLSLKAKLKAHLLHEALLDLPGPYCFDLLKHVFKVELWLLASENVTRISKAIVAFGLDSPASILVPQGLRSAAFCSVSCMSGCELGRLRKLAPAEPHDCAFCTWSSIMGKVDNYHEQGKPGLKFSTFKENEKMQEL